MPSQPSLSSPALSITRVSPAASVAYSTDPPSIDPAHPAILISLLVLVTMFAVLLSRWLAPRLAAPPKPPSTKQALRGGTQDRISDELPLTRKRSLVRVSKSLSSDAQEESKPEVVRSSPLHDPSGDRLPSEPKAASPIPVIDVPTPPPSRQSSTVEDADKAGAQRESSSRSSDDVHIDEEDAATSTSPSSASEEGGGEVELLAPQGELEHTRLCTQAPVLPDRRPSLATDERAQEQDYGREDNGVASEERLIAELRRQSVETEEEASSMSYDEEVELRLSSLSAADDEVATATVKLRKQRSEASEPSTSVDEQAVEEEGEMETDGEEEDEMGYLRASTSQLWQLEFMDELR